MKLDLRQSPQYLAILKQGGCILHDLGRGETALVIRLRRFRFIRWSVIQFPENPEILA